MQLKFIVLTIRQCTGVHSEWNLSSNKLKVLLHKTFDKGNILLIQVSKVEDFFQIFVDFSECMNFTDMKINFACFSTRLKVR